MGKLGGGVGVDEVNLANALWLRPYARNITMLSAYEYCCCCPRENAFKRFRWQSCELRHFTPPGPWPDLHRTLCVERSAIATVRPMISPASVRGPESSRTLSIEVRGIRNVHHTYSGTVSRPVNIHLKYIMIKQNKKFISGMIMKQSTPQRHHRK